MKNVFIAEEKERWTTTYRLYAENELANQEVDKDFLRKYNYFMNGYEQLQRELKQLYEKRSCPRCNLKRMK